MYSASSLFESPARSRSASATSTSTQLAVPSTEWKVSGHIIDEKCVPTERVDMTLHSVALTLSAERTVRCIPLSSIAGVLRVVSQPCVVAFIVPQELDVAVLLPDVSFVDKTIAALNDAAVSRSASVGSSQQRGGGAAGLIQYEESELQGHVRLTEFDRKNSVVLSLPRSRLDFLRLASNKSVVQKLTSHGDRSIQFSDRVHQISEPTRDGVAEATAVDPETSAPCAPNRVLILSEQALYLTDKNGRILHRLVVESLAGLTVYTDEPQVMSFRDGAVDNLPACHIKAKYLKDLLLRLSGLSPKLSVTKTTMHHQQQQPVAAPQKECIDVHDESLQIEEDDDDVIEGESSSRGVTQILQCSRSRSNSSASTLRETSPVYNAQMASSFFQQQLPRHHPALPLRDQNDGTSRATSTSNGMSADRAGSEDGCNLHAVNTSAAATPAPPPPRNAPEPSVRPVPPTSSSSISRAASSASSSVSKYCAMEEEMLRLIEQKDEVSRDVRAREKELQTMQQERDDLVVELTELKSHKDAETCNLLHTRDLETKVAELQALVDVRDAELVEARRGTEKEDMQQETPTKGLKSGAPRTPRAASKAAAIRSRTPGKYVAPTTPKATRKSESPSRAVEAEGATKQLLIDRHRAYIRALERRVAVLEAKDVEHRVEHLERLLYEDENDDDDDEVLLKSRLEYENSELQREVDVLRDDNHELQNAMRALKASFEPVMQSLTLRTKETLLELHSDMNSCKQKLQDSQRAAALARNQMENLKENAVAEVDDFESRVQREVIFRHKDAEARVKLLEKELKQRDQQLDTITAEIAGTESTSTLEALRTKQSRSLQDLALERSRMEQELRSLARQCDDLRRILHGPVVRDEDVRVSALDVVTSGSTPLPSQCVLLIECLEAKVMERDEKIRAQKSAGDPEQLLHDLEQCNVELKARTDALASIKSIGNIDLAAQRIIQLESYALESDKLRHQLHQATEGGAQTKEKLRKLETEHAEAVRRLGTRASESEEQHVALQEEVAKLRSELTEAKQREGRLKKRSAELSTQVSALRTSNEDLKGSAEEVKTLRQTLAARTKEHTESVKEAKVLRRRAEDLERQLIDVASTPTQHRPARTGFGCSPKSPDDDDGQTRALSSMQREVSEKSAEISRLRSRVSHLEAILADVQESHPDLQLEVDVALDSSLVHEKDQRICQLEEIVEQQRRKMFDLKSESERHRSTLEGKLRDAMDQLRGAREEQHSASVSSRRVLDMEDAIATLRQEVQHLRSSKSNSKQQHHNNNNMHGISSTPQSSAASTATTTRDTTQLGVWMEDPNMTALSAMNDTWAMDPDDHNENNHLARAYSASVDPYLHLQQEMASAAERRRANEAMLLRQSELALRNAHDPPATAADAWDVGAAPTMCRNKIHAAAAPTGSGSAGTRRSTTPTHPTRTTRTRSVPKTYSQRLERHIEEAKVRGIVMETRSKTPLRE
eukprot:PhM_4_TR18092/c1_g1_i1/m.49237